MEPRIAGPASPSAARCRNLALVDAFVQALNHRDVDAAAALMSDDCVYLASVGAEADGATFTGVDDVRRGFRAVIETYPDLHYKDCAVLLDGERAAASWTMTGTDSRTGDRIAVRGVDLFEFANGVITRKDAFRKERRAAGPPWASS